MAGVALLGQFEQAVLAAILALRDQAYGVRVHAKVEELVRPKKVSLGAVYITLDRLEEKDWVSSWLADPTPERGGRAKRYFRVEPPGRHALEESVIAARRVWDTVTDALGKDFERQLENREARAR